jgi:hypothetical protein
VTDAPLIATPQGYPLICGTEDGSRFLVVGWTSTGAPVGVRQTPPLGPSEAHSLPQLKPITRGAEELTGELRFMQGGMCLAVEGEISASITGDVTVQGNRSDGSIQIVDVSS